MKRYEKEMIDIGNQLGIIDELCTCDHCKSEHEYGVLGLAEGHGSCSTCDCKKFTWKSFGKGEFVENLV